jgi:methionyl-tRNA formyltransferase
MSDNRMTPALLIALAGLGVRPDVQFLLRPTLRVQLQRLSRKLKGAGVAATVARVKQAFAGPRAMHTEMRGDVARGENRRKVYLVRNFNAASCRALIRASDLDLLIVMTDTIIGRGTFSIPRYGCLNAHPGWLPAYRGLGSTLSMLRDGYAPAITVHFIDEGIDTGPVLLRRTIDARAAGATLEAEALWAREAATLVVEAIRIIEESDTRVPVLDTFLEPSRMTRGIPANEARSIMDGIAEVSVQPAESSS